MEKYFKKLKSNEASSNQAPNIVESSQIASFDVHVNHREVEVNQNGLPMDPGLRKPISEIACNVKEREEIRRTYWIRGPCQPRNHNFPLRQFGNKRRKFNIAWFKDYATWLEYSMVKDAAFCLCCYLFKPEHGGQGGSDSFVTEGFSNWKKRERFDLHVGDHNSVHNKCLKACQDLMDQKQHIDIAFSSISDKGKNAYRIRLEASVRVIRILLRQGLPFRGHNESEESRNKTNFLEFLEFLAKANEEINRVVLDNAPDNHKMIAPSIQKEIANAVASLTTKAIIAEMGDELFSILVDEASDVSDKEQMAIVLRYVDNRGCIVERFLSIVHVTATNSLSLKAAIDSLFSTYGLSMTSLRGQGYDGASNMRGEFNGLKSLILEENASAYYVHCFAHQLQLALVAVARNHNKVALFFNRVTMLTNIIGASCKHKDILREKQFEKMIEGIFNGEVMTGRGSNQGTTLKRTGDTRWSSHYRTIISLISLFSSVIDVLEIVSKKGTTSYQKSQADDLLDVMHSFEFVFLLHLMKTILGITNDLSQSLQRNDQNLVNAMNLVKISKQQLQTMRDNGWEDLLEELHCFCKKHNVSIPKMEDKFVIRGRSRRRAEENTNLHHFKINLFYTVIDTQLQELNGRFNEVNTELLLCMTCLDPSDSFSAFDKAKLIHFARFYPSEYSPTSLVALDSQLENYFWDVRTHEKFSGLQGIGELAQKLVQLKKHITYPLVYLLVKLALILPVATATVERAFSAMKIVKTTLRNRMKDDWMNDCLVTYIERDIFDTIDNEAIMKRFQDMKSKKMLL